MRPAMGGGTQGDRQEPFHIWREEERKADAGLSQMQVGWRLRSIDGGHGR